MDLAGWLQLGLLLCLVVGLTPVLGGHLAGVFGDGPARGDRAFLPVERTVYRLVGVDPKREQRWTGYALSLLAFSVASILGLFAILRLQGELPFNPDGWHGLPPALAFNTAVSFVTNTNWQNYGGEATMSHFSQAIGLATQNFVSAAAGLAVLAALIRGLTRRRSDTVGNFWVDLTRVTVRVLLPLSIVLALALASQGVVQNLDASTQAVTLEGAGQVIPGGPAASQVAIKELGTNGGGFFNTNSSHPFENPNGVTNFLETLAMVVIAFACTGAYGRMVGDRRQGRVVFVVMLVLWLGSVGTAVWAETQGNPGLAAIGADQTVGSDSPGGALEGKEVRFGPATSALWAASTTSTSNGSVNAMHDSLTPVGGLVTLTNMLMGEVSPGGVGVGLTGMLVFVILTVFIAGLVVGRTPEYLGKKIQAGEVKLAVLHVLAMPLVVLGFTAVAVLLPDALASRLNPGPHGFSEILYGFASPGNNNGSAFGGLTSDTAFYNSTQAIAMLVGRFLLIVPVLGLAGSLGRKPVVPASSGTFPTHTPLFGVLLVGVVVIVALLTFFPALALGPIGEALG
ncbi:MAG TPA: potassium-transporting ATPase subunit KdpA [Actinobacteria bacterium]|nr:potassium-transporting ATPase subunit KdpA [Actinomycetota bacterium]